MPLFSGNSTANVICSLQTISIQEIQDTDYENMDFWSAFKWNLDEDYVTL
jgi:hypothetical protein